jgi:hypothetical protein
LRSHDLSLAALLTSLPLSAQQDTAAMVHEDFRAPGCVTANDAGHIR